MTKPTHHLDLGPVSAPSLARAAVAVRDLSAAWSREDPDLSGGLLRAASFWLAALDDLYPGIRAGGLVASDDHRLATVTAAVLTSACLHTATPEQLEPELSAVLTRTWTSGSGHCSGMDDWVERVRAVPHPEGGVAAARRLADRLRREHPGLGSFAAQVRVVAAVQIAALLGRRGDPWVAAALG